MPQALNHQQAPPAGNLRGEIKAKQRGRRIRSVDDLPEEQCQDGELVINGRNADIHESNRLFRPWQELKLPDVRHMVSGAIVAEKVPSGVVASCREEDQGDFCRV